MRLFSFIACLFVIAPSSFASVFVKAGNIYYSQGDKDIQLTSTNHDDAPILSPDKKLIAFIRTGHQIIPQKCRDFADISSKYGNQIWIYNLANNTERLLVDNNFSCNKPKERMVDPQQLNFSPNGKILYFVTSAWVVSGAAHAINVDGTNYHYIQPANTLEVITSGDYRGYLALQQHRYFIGGGSYDWFWLFTPDGKEIGPLGEEPSIK
jgi:hypothetical protein